MRKVLLLTAICATAFAQQFLHLSLTEAQRLALANNPQFASAKLTAAAAYQVPKEYAANYQPTMTGAFTSVGADNGSRLAAGGLNNPVLYNHVGSGLTVGQMLTDFGRTGNLVASAKLRAQAQDQATETARVRILLAVSRDYFSVLRARAVEKVAAETVAARQLVVDQVSALAESKLKSSLDVSFANVNLSTAKLLQTQALNDRRAAEADLATAMGQPRVTGFELDEEPLPPAMPDRVDDLIREAMNSRPELKDLQLQESAEQRFARAEHDLYYPTVGLAGSAGFAPAGHEAIQDRYGAVGLNVTIPIFNGGLVKARQTEAELKARAVSQDINDLQNRVARDVRVSWLNANTAYDRMAMTKQLQDQAQLALDLAQNRYDLGLASMIELSTAQLNVTSAQIEAAQARYEYQTQRVMLDYQTGALR
jgi:outer membrane protein